MNKASIEEAMSFLGCNMIITVLAINHSNEHVAFISADEENAAYMIDNLCGENSAITRGSIERFSWFPIAFAKDHREAINKLYDKLNTIDVRGDVRSWCNAVATFAYVVAGSNNALENNFYHSYYTVFLNDHTLL